jgi:hypothetical protein
MKSLLITLIAFVLLSLSTHQVDAIPTDRENIIDDVKYKVDKKIIEPLLEKGRPILKVKIDEAIERKKPEILNEVPKILRQTFSEVLGISPIGPSIPDCGFFQPICNAVIKPFDDLADRIKLETKKEIEEVMESSKTRCIAAAMVGMKKQMFLSDEAKRTLTKRSLRSWYTQKINIFVSNIMKEVRPEIHVIVVDVKNRVLNRFPKVIQNVINRYLPDSMKISTLEMLEGLDFLSKIKNKIIEWQVTVRTKIQNSVEVKVTNLEEEIMDKIIQAAEKKAAELLPFFDDKDANFKI